MIKVYTKSNCTYCVQAKNLLNVNGVKYEEISLDDPKNLSAFKEAYPNIRTMPQIFVDADLEWINLGGYMELSRYHRDQLTDPAKDVYSIFAK